MKICPIIIYCQLLLNRISGTALRTLKLIVFRKPCADFSTLTLFTNTDCLFYEEYKLFTIKKREKVGLINAPNPFCCCYRCHFLYIAWDKTAAAIFSLIGTKRQLLHKFCKQQ